MHWVGARARYRLPLASLLLIATLAGGCTGFKRWAYGEGPSRDAWQFPDRVIQSLDIEPGDRVADLGAGDGYFTFRLAEAVGPSGIVYAVDIDREYDFLPRQNFWCSRSPRRRARGRRSENGPQVVEMPPSTGMTAPVR